MGPQLLRALSHCWQQPKQILINLIFLNILNVLRPFLKQNRKPPLIDIVSGWGTTQIQNSPISFCNLMCSLYFKYVVYRVYRCYKTLCTSILYFDGLQNFVKKQFLNLFLILPINDLACQLLPFVMSCEILGQEPAIVAQTQISFGLNQSINQ